MLKQDVLLILGAGGHGKSVAEAALLSGQWRSIVFADDSWPQRTEVAGFPIVANIDKIPTLISTITAAIPAVGNNQVRQAWFQKLKDLGIPIATIIHPSAIISSRTMVGEGVCILAGCIVGIDVRVEDGVIVNITSAIDHDCMIGMFSHLSVGVKITGNKEVAPFTFLAAGSVLAH
ncbi:MULTISPECIES: PglD-related sugar-binding protein [Acinetobacter]|uniref:PglD-related sugar-binding protein n=1 Tax=Acinetobacter TaxID=469 RepID=UPI00019ADF3C|nr:MULTISPECIES: acetyltransferase [Acinetobacter]EEH69372.1 sugar O-acyltransferase, sialic acid O-acetyltransferase NeuD family [Acinetobacter sp. ATCC 27244]